MNEATQRQIELQLETLEIKPNNLVILRSEQAVEPEIAMRLRDAIKERFAIDCIVISLPPDVSIELVDLSAFINQ